MYFPSKEIVLQAKFTTLMAVVIWILPLAAIFTPSTISVASSEILSNFICIVPSLWFRYDLDPVMILNWHDSKAGNRLGDLYESVHQNPSSRASNIFTTAAFSDKIATRSSLPANWGTPSLDCHGNCTYRVQFEGPAIKCAQRGGRDLLNSWLDTKAWEPKLEFKFAEVGGIETILYLAYPLERGRKFFVVEKSDDSNTDQTYYWYYYSCWSTVSRYSILMEINGSHYVEPIIKSVDILRHIDDEPSRMLPTLKSTSLIGDCLTHSSLSLKARSLQRFRRLGTLKTKLMRPRSKIRRLAALR